MPSSVTVTSVTPASGPSGGRTLAEVAGSGFRLPASPPATGVVPIPDPTVAVSFGGTPAESVAVISASRLIVVTPRHDPAAAAVPVVVENLDEAGEPIAGQSATLAKGFTFARPVLTAASGLVRLVAAIILELRRQILANVVDMTHTDFSTDLATGGVALAALPALILSGPDPQRNPLYDPGEDAEAERATEAEFDLIRATCAHDLSFRLTGSSDDPIELLNLQHAVLQFFERNGWVYMDRDPDDASAGQVRYALAMPKGAEPRAVELAGLSNLGNFVGSFVVRGYVTEGAAGVTGDLARGRGMAVGDQGAEVEIQRSADE